MYCPNCGEKNVAGANFCKKCGTHLAAAPPSPKAGTAAAAGTPTKHAKTENRHYGALLLIVALLNIFWSSVGPLFSTPPEGSPVLVSSVAAILGVLFLALLVLWIRDLVQRGKQKQVPASPAVNSRPWNWLGTISLIVFIASGSPGDASALGSQVLEAFIALLIVKVLAIVLAIIAVVRGRRRNLRGTWTAYATLILGILLFLFITMGFFALEGARKSLAP